MGRRSLRSRRRQRGIARKSGMSTVSTPGRQSGSRAATAPSGPTSAASPGKSSSAVEPACPAMAIHSPRRRACRIASPRPHPCHQRKPDRQEASVVQRPYSPGAAGNRTRPAPMPAAASNGASKPDSAQMAMLNLTPAQAKTAASAAAVNDSSPSPRCRLRWVPSTRPPPAKTWVMCGSPCGERSAMPKQAPTPCSAVARASAATAG
jgi:hypothetical protein